MRREQAVSEERNDKLVAELFKKHREPLLRHLSRLLGNDTQAEDVLQETYAKFWTIDVRTVKHPMALLFQIASNLAYTQMARRKVEEKVLLREVPLEDDPGKVPGPEISTVLADSLAHVLEQISLLSDGQREVLLLRYLDDMSPADIAKRLDISLGAVNQRLVAGRHELRKRLRDIGIDPDAL